MKKIKISLKYQAKERLFRNQLSSLVLCGEIKTTQEKAKILKREAESFFDKLGKLDELGRVKLCNKVLYGPAIKKALDDRYGAVSIFKIGNRTGDNASVAKIIVEVTLMKIEQPKEEKDGKSTGNKATKDKK